MLRTLAVVLFLLLLPLHSSSAASLVTDANGILTGARDIDYLGNKYDVFIGDGTCEGFFNGCNEQSDFPITASEAFDLNSALLELLVSDGYFTDNPWKIAGCPNDFAKICAIMTPYFLDSINNVSYIYTSVILISNFPGRVPIREVIDSFLKETSRLSVSATETISVWKKQPATTVPEPSTLMLLGIGLLSQRWLRTRGKRVPV